MSSNSALDTNPKNKILLVSLFLLAYGTFFVYNASSTYSYNTFGSANYLLINQLSWTVISILVFFIVQIINLSFIKKISFIAYLFTLLTLFYLFFSSLFNIDSAFSSSIYGAHRWFYINPEPLPEFPFIGRLGFQPSELMKLIFCIFLPSLIYTTNKKYIDRELFIKVGVYILLPFILVLAQPDLKSALILATIGVGILYLAGQPFKYFLISSVALVPIILLSVIFSPYRMQRVIAFFGEAESTASYHVRQINIALGSGGIFGLGFGQSRQKNEYLPEVMGDSIFAVIGEEFGFVGSLFTICVMTFLLFLLYKAVRYINDNENKLIICGVLLWYGIQVFFNLGAVSGVIPLTGVPLPFISYGGSSLLFLVTGLSIVYKILR